MEIQLLELKNIPILEQLRIEEGLLRAASGNFCLLNYGSAPAIVMGISGKPEKLIHVEKQKELQLPLIKRYSGGGTVVIDEDTLFVSFIFEKSAHPFTAFPEPIMRWSENFYQDALALKNFALKENDYVIEERKFGGNAQYIKKNRWVHHTTFLWDYCEKNMASLQLPERRPDYRGKRDHTAFLTKLKEHIPSKEHFFSEIKKELHKRYDVAPVELDEVLPSEDYRIATRLITPFHT